MGVALETGDVVEVGVALETGDAVEVGVAREMGEAAEGGVATDVGVAAIGGDVTEEGVPARFPVGILGVVVDEVNPEGGWGSSIFATYACGNQPALPLISPPIQPGSAPV